MTQVTPLNPRVSLVALNASLNPPDANGFSAILNSTVIGAVDHSICSMLNVKISIMVVVFFAMTFPSFNISTTERLFG